MEDDEVLIKIEYFDTWEEDPLKEEVKNIKTTTEEELKCTKKEHNNDSNSGTKEIDYSIHNYKNIDKYNKDWKSSEVYYEGDCNNDVEYNNEGSSIKESRSTGERECNIESECINEENKRLTWYATIDKTGKYMCKFCPLTYFTVQTLRYHILGKHPTEGYELKKEMENHTRDHKLKCHICSRYFTTMSHLKEHMKRIHAEGDSKHYCHICRAMFANVGLMSAHLARHNIFYSNLYVCNICGYRTGKVSHFKLHQGTHSLEKSFKCKFCKYATNNAANLKTHERVHKSFKPYACPFKGCDYKAASTSALRNHSVKHNPQDNLMYCAECPYKTVYKSCLKRHTDSHLRNTVKTVTVQL